MGGSTLSGVLRSLRYGAAVAASGLTGGNTFESSVYPFIVRNVSLIGIDSVQTPIAERDAVWQEMATAWAPDRIDAMVGDELGLEELAPALELILAGGVKGRMLVRPDRDPWRTQLSPSANPTADPIRPPGGAVVFVWTRWPRTTATPPGSRPRRGPNTAAHGQMVDGVRRSDLERGATRAGRLGAHRDVR